MENSHNSSTTIMYKSQTTVDAVYTEKQPYHSSQNQDEHNIKVLHGQEHLDQHTADHVKSEFYDVTLDLSQEDIQQTLSANMPVSCASAEQLLRYSNQYSNRGGRTQERGGVAPLSFFKIF